MRTLSESQAPGREYEEPEMFDLIIKLLYNFRSRVKLAVFIPSCSWPKIKSGLGERPE